MNTVFFVCFLAGLSLSVIAFVSGLDRLNVFDHIFGHGHHFGGHHHARVNIKHRIGRQGPAGKVSPLNMASITGSLVWFGGAGLLLQQLTPFTTPAVLAGAIVVGLTGGSIVNRFLSALLRRERPLEATSIIGAIARVTSSIRAEETGEIVLVVNGTRQSYGARADVGTAIEKGSEVVVIRQERGIAYVCTWEQLSALTLES